MFSPYDNHFGSIEPLLRSASLLSLRFYALICTIPVQSSILSQQNVLTFQYSVKFRTKLRGSIGSCMRMFIANILGLCDRAESSENSLSPAKPA